MKRKINKAQRLREYDPTEVSFVKSPANFKKFLIHKRAKGAPVPTDADMKAAIEGLPEAVLKAIDASAEKPLVQKDQEGTPELSEGAQAALKAIGRIMAPYRDELKDAHMDAIQEAVGIGDSQVHPGATPDGVAEQDDADDPDNDDEDDGDDDEDDGEDTEGADAADDAGDDESGQNEASDSTPGKSGAIVTQAMGKNANISPAAYEAAVNAATKAFAASLKTAVNKSATTGDAATENKENATMGNSATTGDAAGEQKEQISKAAYDELAAKFATMEASHKELVEKSASRDKELAEQREAALNREYAERAAQYKDVGDATKIAAILKSSHGNKEAQDNLEAILKSAKERAVVAESYGGDLYGEVGTRQGGGASPENEMQALVSQRINKSADKTMSKEQMFVDTVKNTPEGRALYARITGERI